MRMIKLSWNRDVMYMIDCFDIVTVVHNFPVLEYRRRSENENTHLSVTLLSMCGEL